MKYECYNLGGPESERLVAAVVPSRWQRASPCPMSFEHSAGLPKVGELQLELKHSKRDQTLISTQEIDLVVHESLLVEFEKRGFTGYQLRPATVRFRDASISTEYKELIVVGWGGHARPESGITLKEECLDCHRRVYSHLKDGEKLVDWNQWTGEDFFLVCPLPRFTLITKRVADLLLSLHVKTYTLQTLESIANGHLGCGYRVGRPSNYLPEDLAIKYGRPLGLE